MRVGRAWVFVWASFGLGVLSVLARAQEPRIPAPAWGTGAYDARKVHAQQMTAFLSGASRLHFPY